MKFSIRGIVLCTFVAAAMAVWATSGAAFAGGSTGTDGVGAIIRIDAGGGKTGFAEIFAPLMGVSTGPISWQLPGPITILSTDASATPLAVIDRFTATVDQDPMVHYGFAMTAGGSDAHVTVTQTATFAGLVNPEALATAAMTLTDNNGNGAYINGNYPDLGGAMSYRASTNVGTFTDLLGNFTAVPFGSATISSGYPVSGFQVIPGTVNSMTAAYDFMLSRNDSVSLTNLFNIVPAPVPEPASMMLVAGSLAGLLMQRRRRLS